jgi:hypothetical protein
MSYAKVLQINTRNRTALVQTVLDAETDGTRLHLKVNNVTRRQQGKRELLVGDVIDVDERGHWRHVSPTNRGFREALRLYQERTYDAIADLMMPDFVLHPHQRQAGEVLTPPPSRLKVDAKRRDIVPRRPEPWDEENRREDDEFSMWNHLVAPVLV